MESVIFCGEQELALKGHRDRGPLEMDEHQHNYGIFRALLACATYLSWQIQNELINACGIIAVQNFTK